LVLVTATPEQLTDADDGYPDWYHPSA